MPNDTEQHPTSTETMSITTFLLARIAEDEATYQQYKAEVIADLGRWDDVLLSGIDVDYDREMGYPHIGIHASRVLAECEAKRRIVELAISEVAAADSKADDPFERSFNVGAAWFAHNTLLRLALPYADHPDYDKTWRP